MTENQFIEITRWQENTFNNATALSKAFHLQEEVGELIEDIKQNSENKRLEYADCFMLLFGAAKADGMTYSDICNAIEEKFAIIKNRKWGTPDENGVVKHIKE